MSAQPAEADYQVARLRTPLHCKTKAQALYKQNIESHTISFGVGPAGTGKTHVPLKIAAKMYEEKEIRDIVCVRPAVGCGEELGALPGSLEDKVQPWFQPLLDILIEHFGTSTVEGMIHAKRLKFVPLSHMRGRTFKNSFIILDEAQNTTTEQMYAFLTRFGEYSKVVVTGDLRQTDIRKLSGLIDAMRRFQGHPAISFTQFTSADIVRHGLIRDIVEAYERDFSQEEPTVCTCNQR